MTDAQTTNPTYTVKNTETIAAGTDVLTRLFTLGSNDVIPWHFHSHVTDWYFCLAGRLSIETRAPRDHRVLEVGEQYAIPPKTAHRISNGGDVDCRFLLIQGVGQYDYYKI